MSGSKTKTKYVSKGERRSVSSDIPKAVKRDRTLVERWRIKQKAWLNGQNPWIVVPNGNTADTRARYVRIRAETEWGDPRKGFMLGAAAKD